MNDVLSSAMFLWRGRLYRFRVRFRDATERFFNKLASSYNWRNLALWRGTSGRHHDSVERKQSNGNGSVECCIVNGNWWHERKHEHERSHPVGCPEICSNLPGHRCMHVHSTAVVESFCFLIQCLCFQRSFFRNLLMWGFKMFVYVAGVKGLKDTQCGFKLFTRGAASKLFQNLHVERWYFFRKYRCSVCFIRWLLFYRAFDVELLYIAEVFGIRVKEIAVNWQEMEGECADLSG